MNSLSKQHEIKVKFSTWESTYSNPNNWIQRLVCKIFRIEPKLRRLWTGEIELEHNNHLIFPGGIILGATGHRYTVVTVDETRHLITVYLLYAEGERPELGGYVVVISQAHPEGK